MQQYLWNTFNFHSQLLLKLGHITNSKPGIQHYEAAGLRKLRQVVIQTTPHSVIFHPLFLLRILFLRTQISVSLGHLLKKRHSSFFLEQERMTFLRWVLL